MTAEANNDEQGLGEWHPRSLLRPVTDGELRYSSGFLRCQPEKWFPGLGAYWMPFSYGLGSEIKVLEIRPLLEVPEQGLYEFFITVDGEPLGISISSDDAHNLLEVVVPDARSVLQPIAAEYLARRFLSSLGFSWGASESSVVQFHREMRRDQAPITSVVRIQLSLGGFSIRSSILIGRSMTDRLDQLWRKHVHTRTSAERRGDFRLSLELARLDVPAVQLGEYLRPGTLVDLEIPVADRGELLVNEKPWLPARLSTNGDRFVSETLVGSPRQMHGGAGLTRLSVQLGSVTCGTDRLAELSQPGAMQAFDGAQVNNMAELWVGGEQVGSAEVQIYERRFAIRVL